MLSCKKAPEQFAIQNGVQVVLLEQSNDFKIEAATEDVYSCVNYPIVYDLAIEEEEIFIEFKYVEEPELCYTSSGPARATIELGELTLPLYEITFSLNDALTKGTLNTATEELILESGSVFVPN